MPHSLDYSDLDTHLCVLFRHFADIGLQLDGALCLLDSASAVAVDIGGGYAWVVSRRSGITVTWDVVASVVMTNNKHPLKTLPYAPFKL